MSWPGTYEAIAHVWVGVLLCLGFVGDHRKAAWIALGLSSAVEVLMALLK